MTIYTSAALTCQPHQGYCDQGEERTRATVARLGIQWDTLIPMRLILDEMGISDCVFSFCKVKKGCEGEAHTVLCQYMQYLFQGAMQEADIDVELFTAEVKAIRKRCEGYNRPHLLKTAHAAMAYLKNSEPDVGKRHALEALKCLSSDRPDELAATHAGIAMMELGRVRGVDIEGQLRRKLEELMPREDT